MCGISRKCHVSGVLRVHSNDPALTSEDYGNYVTEQNCSPLKSWGVTRNTAVEPVTGTDENPADFLYRTPLPSIVRGVFQPRITLGGCSSRP